jgi:hypothetical protein
MKRVTTYSYSLLPQSIPCYCIIGETIGRLTCGECGHHAEYLVAPCLSGNQVELLWNVRSKKVRHSQRCHHDDTISASNQVIYLMHSNVTNASLNKQMRSKSQRLSNVLAATKDVALTRASTIRRRCMSGLPCTPQNAERTISARKHGGLAAASQERYKC